jgi:hypothetical protein
MLRIRLTLMADIPENANEAFIWPSCLTSFNMRFICIPVIVDSFGLCVHDMVNGLNTTMLHMTDIHDKLEYCMCMVCIIQLSGKLECAVELYDPHAWQAWICAWYAWHEPVAPLCPPCRWSINKSNFNTLFRKNYFLFKGYFFYFNIPVKNVFYLLVEYLYKNFACI